MSDAASEKVLPQVPGYEILEALGQGGMGTVYKARQVTLNRVVALKVLRAGTHAASEYLSRFHTEAKAVAQLHHPNVVQIYEFGEHAGLPYFALEYVGGGDLARNLRELEKQGGQMPVRQAAAMTATLARAVESAHQGGVLHRDLKPSNILLTPDGQPKIADFGLAKQLREPDDACLTDPGVVLGTPAYMAPEQADATHQVNAATDVYALGNIFFEMLTLQRPFPGGSGRLELLLRIKSEKPTPPTRLRPEIPPALESVCLKCLEKEPARRYPTAAALADDLDRWLRGDAVTAQGTSIWQRLARFFSFRKRSKTTQGDRAPGA